MCIEDGELIDLLNHRIVEIYETQGITPLRGFDESYLLPNGKQFLILTHNVFEAVIDIRQTKNIIDDLCFLSEEITFFTAMLYLYQPFVEKPLNNPILIGNKTYYIADQTLEGKRYDFFVDILFEKVYSLTKQKN